MQRNRLCLVKSRFPYLTRYNKNISLLGANTNEVRVSLWLTYESNRNIAELLNGFISDLNQLYYYFIQLIRFLNRDCRKRNRLLFVKRSMYHILSRIDDNMSHDSRKALHALQNAIQIHTKGV